MRKLLIVVVAGLLMLTGCGGGSSTNEVKQLVKDGAVIVDVRTASEYAEGHIDGAQNIDVTAPDFETAISGLDHEAQYVVYCRSGNRSATAKKIMEQQGFTKVYDAGAYTSLKDQLS